MVSSPMKNFLIASASMGAGLVAMNYIKGAKVSGVPSQYVEAAVAVATYIALTYMVKGKMKYSLVDILTLTAVFLLAQSYQSNIANAIKNLISKVFKFKGSYTIIDIVIESFSGGFLVFGLSYAFDRLVYGA